MPVVDERRGLYRDLVLSAAEREFARVGYAEAKMAAIAKASDLSLATVYKTFPGKSEIWNDLHAERMTALLALVEERTAAAGSPLDRLLFDRKRTGELLGFDYQLEMYKPAAKRRWGYWAMPVLYDDTLVGKLDATADREAGVLRVDAVHEDGDWTAQMRAAIDREIEVLAAWLGLVEERS